MDIHRVAGRVGLENTRGWVIVIDVFRAFTVSAYALAGGARQCLLVTDLSEALRLRDEIPGSVICAEVDGRPVAGVPICNSPTTILETDLRNRTLIQRSTQGTQFVGAARSADFVFASSLVVAAATARHVRAARPKTVTLVACGAPNGHVEDEVCADYMHRILLDQPADPKEPVRAIRSSDHYRRLSGGTVEGFPVSDLELALAVDRFDFPMPVIREPGVLRIPAS
jgi:2-phosphosulfolactate phosphatase